MVRLGIVGKTNVGKTTFFNAATLMNAEVSTYPFTTKTPNEGACFAQTRCVCREFNVQDNAKNSACIDGWRFLPVEIVDVPGLIKGAWRGMGLGNQFLQVAMTSDALLHIVDASGSVDEQGRIAEPGTGDPIRDSEETENELVMWFVKVIKENARKVSRMTETRTLGVAASISALLSGLKVSADHAQQALTDSELQDKDFERWNDDDYVRYSTYLRAASKPTIVIANKMDIATADENYDRLVQRFGTKFVIPCAAEAELALRRAEKAGLVKYVPGQEKFEVISQDKLSDKQKWALSYVSERVLDKWMRTGVQFAVDFAVFKLLSMNTIYPVEDERKLADSRGNVLPDAHLMPSGSTTLDLAMKVHTDLAESFIYAIDARTGLRLPRDYRLRDNDVVKIVAARRK